MTTVQTRKALYFAPLLFSAIVTAQNKTNDSDRLYDCRYCTFTSTLPDCPRASRDRSLKVGENSNDLSANSVEVLDEAMPYAETPPESGTIESIMSSYNGNTILFSNVDVNHAANIGVLMQVGRSSIAHWQRRGRIIWIAHTSRPRTSNEREALVNAGFDVILEHHPTSVSFYARSQSIRTTISEILRQQTHTIDLELVSTKEIALQAVLQALSPSTVPSAVYHTEIHQPESNPQLFVLKCDLIAKAIPNQEESYDGEAGNGYMADNEAGDD